MLNLLVTLAATCTVAFGESFLFLIVMTLGSGVLFGGFFWLRKRRMAKAMEGVRSSTISTASLDVTMYPSLDGNDRCINLQYRVMNMDDPCIVMLTADGRAYKLCSVPIANDSFAAGSILDESYHTIYVYGEPAAFFPNKADRDKVLDLLILIHADQYQ